MLSFPPTVYVCVYVNSRYIHNVLEMYESDDTESEISEGTGDPSVKDNASKGLFVKA